MKSFLQIRRPFGADPTRPNLGASRPNPKFDDWRVTGAPGTGRGADVDGSYEPGRLGGRRQSGGGQGWGDWLLKDGR